MCCGGRFGGFVDLLLRVRIAVQVRFFSSTIVQKSLTAVTKSLLVYSSSNHVSTERPKRRLSETILMFHGNTTLFITICQYGVIMRSYRNL